MSNSELKCKAKAQLGGKLFSNAWLMALLVCVIVGAITAGAGTVVPALGATLILGAVEYGSARLFLGQARSGAPMEIGTLFSGFSSDFGELFLLGFLTSLFTALWALLFVIPGIVKAYSWSLIYYIKLDHPEYGWRECMDESAAMMRGYKMKLFLLDLSFIGWYIVGSLCLGVGTLWVVPYHTATHAQFYVERCKEPFVVE